MHALFWYIDVTTYTLLFFISHAGCYVPANFASFRITDKIFSRIGTDDSLETNSSSFLVEMKEMSHIVSHATHRSLIVIGTYNGLIVRHFANESCGAHTR